MNSFIVFAIFVAWSLFGGLISHELAGAKIESKRKELILFIISGPVVWFIFLAVYISNKIRIWLGK